MRSVYEIVKKSSNCWHIRCIGLDEICGRFDSLADAESELERLYDNLVAH